MAGVRDNSAEALGTSMRVVGEKVMLPYIDQLDKIKAEKVRNARDLHPVYVIICSKRLVLSI